jgi:DNA-directed RNA polymerase specialized sigma24 family protein
MTGTVPTGSRPAVGVTKKLPPESAAFYADVWEAARAGCVRVLRHVECSESEAEEIFAEVFADVMAKTDPIQREFHRGEMVNFLKVACRRKMIDHRRRDAAVRMVALTESEGVGDFHQDGPAELAVRVEAIELGREALLALSKRDRLIFELRHYEELSPEEVRLHVPGLSALGYRKAIKRANSKVLAAYQRIDSGERCTEMTNALLARSLAEDCTDREREEVGAHIEHCRVCRQIRGRMGGYLFDVASSLAGFMAVARTTGLAAVASASSLPGERARLRARTLAHRVAESLPGGSTTDPGQILGFTGAKVGGVCASVAAVVTCAAMGVIPGVSPTSGGAHRQSLAPRIEAPSPPKLSFDRGLPSHADGPVVKSQAPVAHSSEAQIAHPAAPAPELAGGRAIQEAPPPEFGVEAGGASLEQEEKRMGAQDASEGEAGEVSQASPSDGDRGQQSEFGL